MSRTIWASPEIVIPSRRGRDLDSLDGKLDGHIRIESGPSNHGEIVLDLFDSTIRNASRAHLGTKSFTWDENGASEATEYLRKKGFRTIVLLK